MLYTLYYHDPAASRVRSAARFSFIIGDFSRHTHTCGEEGGPLYRTSLPIAHSVQAALSAKVCNRWLSVCHISQGVSREPSCNPAILYFPTVNLGQERLLPHMAQTARQGARCLTRDVERKAGGWPISKFRSSHDRGNSSTIPAVREDVEPYGPAEAPRQDVGHAHCLACLDFGPFLLENNIPMVMLKNARTAVSREVCCTAGLLLEFLADIVAHVVHFLHRTEEGAKGVLVQG